MLVICWTVNLKLRYYLIIWLSKSFSSDIPQTNSVRFAISDTCILLRQLAIFMPYASRTRIPRHSTTLLFMLVYSSSIATVVHDRKTQKIKYSRTPFPTAYSATIGCLYGLEITYLFCCRLLSSLPIYRRNLELFYLDLEWMPLYDH